MKKLSRNQKFNDLSDSDNSKSDESSEEEELEILKSVVKTNEPENTKKKINLFALKKLLNIHFKDYNKLINNLIRDYNKNFDSQIIEKEFILIRNDFLCILDNILKEYDLKNEQYDYIDILLEKSYKKINKIFE
jgi:hypothetical protein